MTEQSDIIIQLKIQVSSGPTKKMWNEVHFPLNPHFGWWSELELCSGFTYRRINKLDHYLPHKTETNFLLFFLSLSMPCRPRYRCWNCFKLELPNVHVHGKWILKKVSSTGEKCDHANWRNKLSLNQNKIGLLWNFWMMPLYDSHLYTCAHITSKLRTKHNLFVWLICDKSMMTIHTFSRHLQKKKEQQKSARANQNQTK